MTFSITLPAPGSLINSAGMLDSRGHPAPGFSGVGLTSNMDVGNFRTRSNRGLTISEDDHFWSFTISYHPMTIEEYTAIENFLLGHNTRKNPFYVTLPNYSIPRTKEFANYANNNVISVAALGYAGDTTIVVNSAVTSLLPGSFINIEDTDDALHQSIYKVARVETPSLYTGTAPAAGTMRLTIFPALQRDINNTTCSVRFIDPQFRVIQTSKLNPQFDENNTVTFSMEVEELLP